MGKEGPSDDGDNDSRDRPPEQSPLEASDPMPKMSAAVAPADLKGSSHPSSGSLVVPLRSISASLSRHGSLHALSESEPAQKKRRIGENGIHLPKGPSTANAASAVSSENNSSCDSIPGKPAQSPPSHIHAPGRVQKETDKSIKSTSELNSSLPGGGDSSAKLLATTTIATSPTPAKDSSPSTETASASTLTDAAATVKPTPSQASMGSNAPRPEEKPPLKSTKMIHLRQKYTGELEYMLREFEKLERQLLGARKTEESAASRERREKLHSFILHLTETIQQIEKGCELEAAGKSTLPATQALEADTSLAAPSKDKEEEESIQKLEEHILANLLPVKVRLKKQLAAQQGAKHNPATMPHRGGHAVRPEAAAGTTFADAARRQQEATQVHQGPIPPPGPVAPDETQFGKPLVQGSSLTKKLHGPTLGSSDRAHGDGVGAADTMSTAEKKKYIGGLAVGSTQMESSFDAASNVHKLVIQEPALVLQTQVAYEEAMATAQGSEKHPPPQIHRASVEVSAKPAAVSQLSHPSAVESSVSDEKRRKLLKKKRKKIRLREQARAAAAEKRKLDKGRKLKMAKKSHRGPRHVEYLCALCNEVYNSTCDYNPWWALTQHDCPKCKKRQIPRVDIGAPANTIEYHPALLAHADDNGAAPAAPVAPVAEIPPAGTSNGENSDEESLGVSDVSSDCDDISTDDDDSFESDTDGLDALSPADRAEQERFGAEYSGPALENSEASRLLVLMAHASTCPCQHISERHRDTCRSVKWMMLHVRDCPGTTSNFDVCPFPWCRKVKHLLYHLVSCRNPESCEICSPSDHGLNLVHLKALNDQRLQSFREKLLSKFPTSSMKPPSDSDRVSQCVQVPPSQTDEKSCAKPTDEESPGDRLSAARETEPTATEGAGTLLASAPTQATSKSINGTVRDPVVKEETVHVEAVAIGSVDQEISSSPDSKSESVEGTKALDGKDDRSAGPELSTVGDTENASEAVRSQDASSGKTVKAEESTSSPDDVVEEATGDSVRADSAAPEGGTQLENNKSSENATEPMRVQ